MPKLILHKPNISFNINLKDSRYARFFSPKGTYESNNTVKIFTSVKNQIICWENFGYKKINKLSIDFLNETSAKRFFELLNNAKENQKTFFTALDDFNNIKSVKSLKEMVLGYRVKLRKKIAKKA